MQGSRSHDPVLESDVRKGIRITAYWNELGNTRSVRRTRIRPQSLPILILRFKFYLTKEKYLLQKRAPMDRGGFSSVSPRLFPLQSTLHMARTKVRAHLRDAWYFEGKNHAQDLLPPFLSQDTCPCPRLTLSSYAGTFKISIRSSGYTSQVIFLFRK